jgi:hypothetical protein
MNQHHGDCLTLSLMSHTNVGKTTLMRTLLGEDVGEVLDRAHVTLEVSAHTLLQGPEGQRLVLCDTPGFGDSARLLKRLREHEDPLGWIKTESFDSQEQRALFCDREALSSLPSTSDVLLYLVNASESPQDRGYVDLELEILSLLELPVLILLNQTGAMRTLELMRDVHRWEEATARWPAVRGVLGLDAFTRCWVQEGRLFECVRDALPEDRRPLAESLLSLWREEHLDTLRKTTDLFAAELVRAAADSEPIITGAWGSDKQQAARALGERMEAGTLRVVDSMIVLHGLDGRSHQDFKADQIDFKAYNEQVAPKRWGILGGAGSGLLTGLGADLAAGGLSFGTGALLGALLGGTGGLFAARGYNSFRAGVTPCMGWSPEVLDRDLNFLLQKFLAVAHFGRGRGAWREASISAHWRDAVSAALADRKVYTHGVWKSARGETDEQALFDLRKDFAVQLAGTARSVLKAVYPEAGHWL